MRKYTTSFMYVLVVGLSFAGSFWMSERKYPFAPKDLTFSAAIGSFLSAGIASAIIPFIVFACVKFRKTSFRFVGGLWLILLVACSGLMLYGSRDETPIGRKNSLPADAAGVEFMKSCVKSAEGTPPFSGWSTVYREEYCMCAASKSRLATRLEDYADIDKRGYLNSDEMSRILVKPAIECSQEMAGEHAELRPVKAGATTP